MNYIQLCIEGNEKEWVSFFFFAPILVHHVTSRQLERLAQAQYFMGAWEHFLKMQGGKEHFSNFGRHDGERFVCRRAKCYIIPICSEKYRYLYINIY